MTNNTTEPTTPQLGAIWAQTKDGIIGRNGTMPWHVPEDLNHFKEITAGKPVIMGRRTWESLPEPYKPLPGRANVVITQSVSAPEERDGAIWAPSLDMALEEAYKAPQPLMQGNETLTPDVEVLQVASQTEPTPEQTLPEPVEPEAETGEEDTISTTEEPVEYPLVDAWIIGGGTLYAEALARNNLPHYKRVSIIERTVLTAIDETPIPGDTKAPMLTGWEILIDQPPKVSADGYLLDEPGGMCPAVYVFQTLTRENAR
jgi:dihydrofolate reductase